MKTPAMPSAPGTDVRRQARVAPKTTSSSPVDAAMTSAHAPCTKVLRVRSCAFPEARSASVSARVRRKDRSPWPAAAAARDDVSAWGAVKPARRACQNACAASLFAASSPCSQSMCAR